MTPSTESVDRYAADVDCYVKRVGHYPAEWWDRIPAKDARGYFDEFVKALRPAH